MPGPHPPLTIGFLKQWLKDNHIPDDHVITGTDRLPVRAVSRATCWTASAGEVPAVRLYPDWDKR